MAKPTHRTSRKENPGDGGRGPMRRQHALRPQTEIEIMEGVADELGRRIRALEVALREVEARTRAYAEDYDGWPLVAGIHEVARKALSQ